MNIMESSFLQDLKMQYDRVVVPETDPRSREWFLVTKYPVIVLSVSLIYLVVINVGPMIMKSRQAFECRSFLVVYNFMLVFASLYMAVEMFLSYRHANYVFTCSSYNSESWKDPRELRMATVLWWYYASKYIELLDTILMVLKKKNSQITWLHVVHHVSIMDICWMMVVFFPGGMMWFGCWLNCMVHTFMYSYYGLAAIPAFKPYVQKWRKYITRLQLTQFILVVLHIVYHIWTKCDFPLWGEYVQLGYTLLLVALFVNFYQQAYREKKNAKKTLKEKSECANGEAVGSNGMLTEKTVANSKSSVKKRV